MALLYFTVRNIITPLIYHSIALINNQISLSEENNDIGKFLPQIKSPAMFSLQHIAGLKNIN